MVGRLIRSAWGWLVGIGVVFCACDSPDQPVITQPVSANDLIELNQRKAQSEANLIDSVVRELGWADEPQLVRSSAGIRMLRGAELSAERLIEKGDTISWVGRAMLLDSTVLFDWGVDQPFSMIFESSNWPIGFHELSAELAQTNSVSALIPSNLGWGLSGWPPLIPQDAVLWLDVTFADCKPQAKEGRRALSGTGWSAFIAAFESGEVWHDQKWIRQRDFVTGPCLSWYDSTSKSNGSFTNGEHIQITMRTFKSTIDQASVVDLGWNEWSFQVGEDQQVLPVLEAMMRRYPKRNRWECHCPVDYAFGAKGVPSVGLGPKDVVGFQWEWGPIDVEKDLK